jgi:hypothetical protein
VAAEPDDSPSPPPTPALRAPRSAKAAAKKGGDDEAGGPALPHDLPEDGEDAPEDAAGGAPEAAGGGGGKRPKGPQYAGEWVGGRLAMRSGRKAAAAAAAQAWPAPCICSGPLAQPTLSPMPPRFHCLLESLSFHNAPYLVS